MKGFFVDPSSPSSPPKSATEHLKTDASEIIGDSGCMGFLLYKLVIQSLPEKKL